MSSLTSACEASSSPPRLKTSSVLGAIALLLLSGLLIGVSHLHAGLWPLAWIGMVAMGLGASLRLPWPLMAAGLFVGGVIQLWVGHPWHWGSMTLYLPPGPWSMSLGLVVFTTLWILTLRLPILIAWLVGRRFNLPALIWLPPGWLAGESLWDAGTALSHGDWLYTQWQVTPVLRMLHGIGWELTTLLCLAAAISLGDALVRRSLRPLAAPALLVAALWFAPTLPTTGAAVFEGIGAVTMSERGRLPRALPEGLSLVVWPEVASARRPGMASMTSGRRVPPPVDDPKAVQLLGMLTRSAQGEYNVVAAIGPDKRLIAVRAKERLFPITETPFFGYMVPRARPTIPGRTGPLLDVHGRRYASLVCLEGFDRHLARAGRQAGAEMLVVSASDRVLAGSRLGQEQVLATCVMRAVETGLPLVRASVSGSAAFVLPDGRVVATTEPGQDGVLTTRGEVPSYGRPYVMPAGQAQTSVDAAVIYSSASPDLQAALPIGRCAFFPVESFRNPGVRAKTVVVGGHSSPPLYLDRPADELVRAIASFEPELVVLDTCFGASTPILQAMADAGLKVRVVAPAYRIPKDGFIYGSAFLDTADPARRAAMVRTEPAYPVFNWVVEGRTLDRIEHEVARLDADELRMRLKRTQPPLIKFNLPGQDSLAARLLVSVPMERFRKR